MPSERVEARIRDILHYAEVALRMIEGMTFDQFRDDERTYLAASRCLEIISEASRHIPPNIKERHAGIAWREMATAGNIYRHEYDVVEERLVWETVRKSLPPLIAAMNAELKR